MVDLGMLFASCPAPTTTILVGDSSVDLSAVLADLRRDDGVLVSADLDARRVRIRCDPARGLPVKQMTGREALADAFAAELDMDIESRFMAGVDRVLIRLWLHGYSVLPVSSETGAEEYEQEV